MSLVKILLERKNYPVLYHFTSYGKLELILRNNLLKPSRGVGAISLTRNHRLEGFGSCRISLDAKRLSDRYKIAPYFDAPYDAMEKKYDYSGDSPRRQEQEERIQRPIKNVKKYIIQVDIKTDQLDDDFSKNKAKRIRDQIANNNPNVEINIVEHWQPVKNWN